MSKVLFVATVVKKHINVFHIPYLKMFKENGWETSVCARNDFEKNENSVIPYCDNYYDLPFERFPLKVNNIKVFKKLREIISLNSYNIVHCHTPTAGMLARFASLKNRKKNTKVIYTAHGFHFFKGAPIINWLLYFPVEWLCSFFTDVLITINKEDYAFAKKYMQAKEIKYVPGVGIDCEKINNTAFDRAKKRQELGIDAEQIALLSVGELNDNKNHETVIRAISRIKNDNITYIICGKGDKEEYLKSLADELGVNLILPGYRNDIVEIYKSCDLFVFPSKREGLSAALMEAMAAGLPVVCSNIRGNTDLIKEECGGYLVAPDDVQNMALAIKKIAEDDKLCQRMGEYNKKAVLPFNIECVKSEMRKIYLKETKRELVEMQR